MAKTFCLCVPGILFPRFSSGEIVFPHSQSIWWGRGCLLCTFLPPLSHLHYPHLHSRSRHMTQASPISVNIKDLLEHHGKEQTFLHCCCSAAGAISQKPFVPIFPSQEKSLAKEDVSVKRGGKKDRAPGSSCA